MTNFSSTKKANEIQAEKPVQNNKKVEILLDRLNHIKNELTKIKSEKEINVRQIFQTYILKLRKKKQTIT